MNIALEKKRLIRQFNEVEDESVILAIKNILESDEHTPLIEKIPLAYAPEVIGFNNRKYILNYPLRCLVEPAEDHVIIKSEQLDIYAVGKSIQEAEVDFSEEFDYLYRTLNSFPNDKLSERLNDIKIIINFFVKSSENGN
jgi:hypothetical protein